MKIGVLAGSFDLTTKGHIDMIQQATKLVDKLYVIIAVNAGKTFRFDPVHRMSVMNECLREIANDFDSSKSLELQGLQLSRFMFSVGKTKTTVQAALMKSNELLVTQARKLKADVLIRGIRNAGDFDYEKSIADVNREINDDLTTAFVVPKPDLAKVSSSLVHGIVGTTNWEEIISKWVQDPVITAYQLKLASTLKK